MEYEILQVCADRGITKIAFDEFPYKIKVEMVSHWELNQEIQEYLHQEAEREAKERERKFK